MAPFTLRYARIVIFEAEIEAENEEAALHEAMRRENNAELGFDLVDGKWDAKPGSTIEEIEDYDQIWEVTENDD